MSNSTVSGPTVVLVHGAFSSASAWFPVMGELLSRGCPVVGPALPLRGTESDAAYLASFLRTVEGPVVLAGHSYAGAVIAKAAADAEMVRALVFVAAVMPEEGESVGDLFGRFPGSLLGAETTATAAYPGGTDLYMRPESFRDVLAGDVPAEITALLAATQRPLDAGALEEKFTGTPAWHTVPTWSVYGTEDRALPVATSRFMAQRAKAESTEVEASHLLHASQSTAVATVILEAVNAVRDAA